MKQLAKDLSKQLVLFLVFGVAAGLGYCEGKTSQFQKDLELFERTQPPPRRCSEGRWDNVQGVTNIVQSRRMLDEDEKEINVKLQASTPYLDPMDYVSRVLRDEPCAEVCWWLAAGYVVHRVIPDNGTNEQFGYRGVMPETCRQVCLLHEGEDFFVDLSER